jgi:hypothetical protein
MKADNRILIKLLPALALMVGCIAQTGTPDDQSSSSEALSTGTTQGAPTVQPAGPAEKERVLVRENALRQGRPADEGALTAPGYDPGAPVSGDGDDPDPHPWEPHATGIAVH